MRLPDRVWLTVLLVPALLFIAGGMIQQVREPPGLTSAGPSPREIARLRAKWDRAGLTPHAARFWKPL